MLLKLQIRQVHIHILLVIWGLAEEEDFATEVDMAEQQHNPNLLRTSSCS